jgi:sphingomyelin phosphodiesterase acid-like 3
VVRLALFGHSHTDEMRLLTPTLGSPQLTLPTTISGLVRPEQTDAGVAVKVLPSISPVFAELPSFTLAAVDSRTATLVDYSVILASNSTGIETSWTKSYTFSDAYHLSAFSPATLAPLIAQMQSDPTASTPASEAYIREYRHYFFNDGSPAIKSVWPQLACAMKNISDAAFTQCVCAASTTP